MQILTKKIEAFNFDELSGQAKDEIRFSECANWWVNPIAEEFKKTLDGFCYEFDIKWDEYDISPAHINYKMGYTNDKLRNYDPENDEDILYLLSVNKSKEDCPITGVYCDELILKPIRKLEFSKKFCDSFYQNFDIEQLWNDCINNWLKGLQAEYDYHLSDEGLNEMCKANEYLFTKDGKLIK